MAAPINRAKRATTDKMCLAVIFIVKLLTGDLIVQVSFMIVMLSINKPSEMLNLSFYIIYLY